MQRPRGVTLLAILALVIAGSNLLTGVMLIAGNLTFSDVFGPVPDLGELQAEFEHIMRFILLVLSLGILGVGIGLLTLKNWARATMRVLAVLGILGALITMVKAFSDGEAGRFLFCALLGGAYYWAFYYLGQKPIRAAFAPPPPGETPPPASPGGDPAA